MYTAELKKNHRDVSLFKNTITFIRPVNIAGKSRGFLRRVAALAD